jgi:hypothetical protein
MTVSVASVGQVAALDCEPQKYERYTEDVFFALGSASGAVGDVVAVDLSLHFNVPSEVPGSIKMFLSYPTEWLELASNDALMSEVGEDLAFYTRLGPVTDSTSGPALSFIANFSRDAARSYFPSEELITIATVYFRITGQPTSGSVGQIQLTDITQEGAPRGYCNRTRAYHYSTSEGIVYSLSRNHIPAQITVLQGPPTHTEPPPEPAAATVYPTAPTKESASIVFEHGGAVARPGSADVPIDVFVTSSHDFSSFTLSVPFPSEYLTLTRVEEYHGRGAALLRDDQGHLSYAKLNTRRRIGAEGERVKLVTLHFALKEAAADQSEIAVALGDFTLPGSFTYSNWLGILHEGPLGEPVPTRAEVAPLRIEPGVLKVQSQPTVPGDVNLDYRLTIADAVSVLVHLYIDRSKTICASAADFDADGTVALQDAIAILRHLFIGDFVPVSRAVFCN